MCSEVGLSPITEAEARFYFNRGQRVFAIPAGVDQGIENAHDYFAGQSGIEGFEDAVSHAENTSRQLTRSAKIKWYRRWQ